MTALTRVRAALAAGARPSDDDVREVCAELTSYRAAVVDLADRGHGVRRPFWLVVTITRARAAAAIAKETP